MDNLKEWERDFFKNFFNWNFYFIIKFEEIINEFKMVLVRFRFNNILISNEILK